MARELEAAMTRLTAALAALDGAVARHLDIDGRTRDLETELQIMGEDRARLALELDSATVRLARLQSATDHVERRVQLAVVAIRTVLGGDEAASAAGRA